MKSLAKNSIYNIIYKCLNLVFPLIISAYVSRILFAEGVGKVSSAQNIVTYFSLLAALGLPTYGTKVIASCGKNRMYRNKAFSELFIINAGSTLICTVVHYSLVCTIPYFQQRSMLSIVCGLAIIFNVINVDWFYQGREEYGYIMLRSFLIKLLSLIAVFVFVKSVNDYIMYAAILTLSKVANNVFNIIHLHKDVSFTIKKINVAQHIRPVFVFLAASIAIEVYTLADTTMLTFIHGDNIVGYYATARKGIDVIRTMIIAVCSVFLPRLSYYYANSQIKCFNDLMNKGIKILIYMTIPAMVGVILTAKYFIPLLFGADFSNAILTTQILSFSIVTVAFSNFFGYQVLATIGKEQQMLISTIVGAIVNIILNFALVFSYKHNGVAVASAITEFCVAFYQILVVRKNVQIEIQKKFIISVVFGTMCMFFSVLLCRWIIDNQIACLLISIITGCVVYFLTTLITKNEMSEMVIKILKKNFIMSFPK